MSDAEQLYTSDYEPPERWIKVGQSKDEMDFVDYGGTLLRGNKDNHNSFEYIILLIEEGDTPTEEDYVLSTNKYLFRGKIPDITEYMGDAAVKDYAHEHGYDNVGMLFQNPLEAAKAIANHIDVSGLAPMNMDGAQPKPDHMEDFLITYEQLITYMREEGMLGFITDELRYEAYKEVWVKDNISESQMEDTIEFYQNREPENEGMTFAEYVNEYGFAGDMRYDSFEEWQLKREMAQTAYDEAAAVYRMANGLDDYDNCEDYAEDSGQEETENMEVNLS